MKQIDVFGVRRAILLYALALGLSVVGIAAFTAFYLIFGQDWLFWCIFLMVVVTLYMGYLLVYEAYFRYGKEVALKGHFVVAEVSWHDPFGRPREKISAIYATEKGELVGLLLGNFSLYRQKLEEGSKIYCFLLDDGRFLAVDPRSKLYKDPAD